MSLLPSFYMVQMAFAPLPPFIANALTEIEVETSIDSAAMFRLHFDLSKTAIGDYDALIVDLFRPLVPIRISLSFGLGLPMTIVNGYIRDVRLTASNAPGGSRLEVTGADAMGTLMGHIQVPMPWPNVPDSTIVTAIFGKYAIAPLVVPTPPTRTILDTVTTQQTRDNAFVRQIASFHNYEVFTRPDPIAGFELGIFSPMSALIMLPPQGVLSIDFGSQTNLTGFQVFNQMLRPKTLIGVMPEPNTRAPIPVIAPVAAEMPMGLEPSLARIIPPPIEVTGASDAANVAERTLQAFAEVTASARTVRASGELDGIKFARPLMPGLPVLVRGAGRQHSGLYLVTSVSHRMSRDGYTQGFEAIRNAVGLTGAEIFLDPLAPVT